MIEPKVEAVFRRLLWRLRWRLLAEKLLPVMVLLVLLTLQALLWWSHLPSPLVALVALMALAVVSPVLAALILWSLVRGIRRLTLANLAAHLNTRFNTLQHSCQLLLAEPQGLNPLQQWQRQRVGEQLLILERQQQLNQALPGIQFKWTLLSLMFSLVLSLLLVGSDGLRLWPDGRGELAQGPPEIVDLQVKITPPAYSGLPIRQQQHGDLEVLEGSLVQWQFSLAPADKPLPLRLSFGDQSFLALKALGNGQYTGQKPVSQTGLYHLVDGQEQPLSAIFSLATNKDQPPKVRLLSPRETLLIIDKDGPLEVEIKAAVSDDLGLSKVQIMASVAKGSGEAVKFRDQRFEFDRISVAPQGNIYHKQWRLPELGMEPGDEVYFSVLAFDNKQPKPQQGRSPTVIVRWLDEQRPPVAGQGLLLNYAQEYFRSQRQIIIETEQLIADRDDLDTAGFEQKAISLGQSQGDLKQRYGQYLGDESNEGSQLSESVAERLAEAAHQQTQEHDHEHAHQHQQEPDKQGDAKAVLAQMMHQHEEVDVGEVSSQNPRAMMKKALGFMWQAELQLLLSKPEVALPFARRAYQFLKLAKQAERIYVQRLGFEPPPVSEEKRLSGELEDIVSIQTEQQLEPGVNDDDDELFRQGFALLNTQGPQQPFSTEQQQLLTRLQQRLTQLAESRPVLIKQAATVAKMRLVNRAAIAECRDCATHLQQKLWQLIASPVGRPLVAHPAYLATDKKVGRYLHYLQGVE